MRWGLVPSHDLTTPFVVAWPLEVNNIIIIRVSVHMMSGSGEMLTVTRMKVV